MSAELISNRKARHNFKDDLESSLYVLMWVIMMYSPVSPQELVPTFLSGVLDLQAYREVGGMGKHDFLMGRSILNEVEFNGREALHKLVFDLAGMFNFRYVKGPTTEARANSALLRASLPNNEFRKAFDKQDACFAYDQEIRKLEGHAATIELFDIALRNPSEWPDSDCAVR